MSLSLSLRCDQCSWMESTSSANSMISARKRVSYATSREVRPFADDFLGFHSQRREQQSLVFQHEIFKLQAEGSIEVRRQTAHTRFDPVPGQFG